MNKVKCLDKSEIRLSLNWAFPKDIADIDIRDAVEDATSAEEMVYNLNKLKPYNKFTIDRVTHDYVRVVSVDKLGNKTYIKANF